jgi:hypothetical protein
MSALNAKVVLHGVGGTISGSCLQANNSAVQQNEKNVMVFKFIMALKASRYYCGIEDTQLTYINSDFILRDTLEFDKTSNAAFLGRDPITGSRS